MGILILIKEKIRKMLHHAASIMAAALNRGEFE